MDVLDSKEKVKANPGKYYIYYHIDPRTDLPRYAGKGSGMRAWDFYNRNEHHKNWVKKLKTLGLKPIVDIGNFFESEKEAYEIEAIEVDLLRKLNLLLINQANGGLGGVGGQNKKAIICLNNNKTYESTKAAGLDLNINVKRINSVLKATKKSYKGYKFKYLDENLNVLPDEIRKEKAYKRAHTTSKKIICNETDKTYLSITEAAIDLGIGNSHICQQLNGKIKKVKKKFTFRRL